MAIDLIAALHSNPFVLAPMAGITDSCFRSFMRDLGCGPVITELVSAHGIEHKSHRTAQLMAFEPEQRPVGIQLFGETPEVLAAGARVVEASGADFVDLNFGCPVPKVVKKGAGSAILRDLAQVERVFRAVKSATSLPVTVKIRTGWDEHTRNADKVVEIAHNEGLTWVAIHGRTRAAGYSGLADWDFIANVKAKARLPILGNGDIASAEGAVRRMRETGVDGVMIGRGCLKNPWIFADANALWASSRARDASDASVASVASVASGVSQVSAATSLPASTVASSVASSISPDTQALPNSSGIELKGGAHERDFVALFLRLHAAFEKVVDQRITLLQIKKFASWYSSGYPGASNFRKAIFQTQTVDETLAMTLEFFTELRSIAQADTSHEEFLMGGHG